MSSPIDRQRQLDAILRNDFTSFTMRVFQLLLSGEQGGFIMGQHIDAMCHAVQQCLDGKYNRLILEVPPRHGKSITVSTALPAFLLGRDPKAQILVASYGKELAEEHTRHTRQVIQHEEYRRLFPDTQIRRDREGDLITTLGGRRKGVSTGGATTGFGADLVIVDDLIKADSAHSEADLRRAQDYLSSSLITRLNNQETGKVIVIQQRLSELDPVGYLREIGGYHVLSLPAIAQVHQTIPLCRGKTWPRTPGDLLFPERHSRDTLDRLEREMGKARFSAQYLQNPTPVGGNRLSREWFKSYDFKPTREMFQFVIQSWDTGQSVEAAADYSVCTTWGLTDNQWHLIDVYRDKLDYYELRKKAHALNRTWSPDKIIIEKANSGMSLLDDLRSAQGGLRAKANSFKVRTSKEERFEEAIAQIEDGRFALPTEAPWLQVFINELLSFPNGRHDDQVDSVSQFILWEKSGFGQAVTNRQRSAILATSASRRQQRHDYYARLYALEDARNEAARDRLLKGKR